MKDTTRKGRPPKLKLTEAQQEKYITTRSHSRLAKELGVKLSELKAYAEENGLDEESRLYWEDVSLERLKEAVESPETDEVSATHINSLIKTLRSYKPKGEVGRPSEKKAFEKGMNAAQRDQEEFDKHVERMRGK